MLWKNLFMDTFPHLDSLVTEQLLPSILSFQNVIKKHTTKQALPCVAKIRISVHFTLSSQWHCRIYIVANLKRIHVMISWPDYLRMLLCITKISKGCKYVITFLLAINFLIFGRDYENDDVLVVSMTHKECRTQN